MYLAKIEALPGAAAPAAAAGFPVMAPDGRMMVRVEDQRCQCQAGRQVVLGD